MRKTMRRIRKFSKSHSGPQFNIEKKILTGKTIRTKTDRSSVLFFATQETAAEYANQVLCELLRFADYLTVDLVKLRSPTKSSKGVSAEAGFNERHILPHGIYYGAFDKLVTVDPQKKLKRILQLSDPRDAMTSEYIAAKSNQSDHGEPQKQRQLEEQRAKLSQQTIDEFVTQASEERLKTLLPFSKSLFEMEDVLVIHYEDMVIDFSSWLDNIIDYLELPRTHHLQATICRLQEADAAVQKDAHQRQKVLGEHKRQLQPETISFLDRTFVPYFSELTRTGNLPQRYHSQDSGPQQKKTSVA